MGFWIVIIAVLLALAVMNPCLTSRLCFLLSERTIRPVRRKGRTAGALLAAAGIVVACAAGAVLLGHAASGDTFVATVPWSSAVIETASGRTLTVETDLTGMDDRFDCGPVMRSKVSETPHSVVVRVEVFNRPLPPNVACAGVGLGRVAATVHLRSELGTRTLIDGSGDTDHPVLVVDRTPAPTAVPEPFTRRSTSWDESTGEVDEWWRWQRHDQAQQIDLELGPMSTAAGWGPTPSDASRASIGRGTAEVWRQNLGDTVTTTVTWSPQAGRSARLTMIDQARDSMSEDQVLALARSVR